MPRPITRGNRVRAVVVPYLGQQIHGKVTIQPGDLGTVICPLGGKSAFLVVFDKYELQSIACYSNEIERV